MLSLKSRLKAHLWVVVICDPPDTAAGSISMFWQSLLSDDLRLLWLSQEQSSSENSCTNLCLSYFAFTGFSPDSLQEVLTSFMRRLEAFGAENHSQFILNVKSFKGLLTSASTLEALQKCSHDSWCPRWSCYLCVFMPLCWKQAWPGS